MHSLRESIVEILIKSKQLSKEQLDKAIEAQKAKQAPLRKILIQQKLITEDQLLSLLSEELFIPTLHLAKYKFDPEILSLIPERLAKQYSIIPLSRIGNTLTVAMSDPLNIFALDDLKTLTGCNIDTVLSSETEIMHMIETQYHQDTKDIQQILDESGEGQGSDDTQRIKPEEIELSSAIKESEKPPIIKIVELMLTQALKKRASDIHIEPEEDCLRVRYRIDGSLHDILKLPKKNQNAVLARLKIISNLDITENRLPQDGRFKVKFENKEVDFRVSALPTTFGQKFVLRLLDKSNLSIGLEQLGFSDEPKRVFKEAVAKPFGMILVTGPTGSGKSTTLYSVLNQLNTPERNIITIEDPVEYQIEGITQVQARPDIGLDFSSGLRSLLRQSPDVILIGEIRDAETADIAVKAALTGQVVLSTLHTNDAISSVTRLIDMGVEPFLVASSLIMLCAQRLARKLCLKCRKPTEISPDFLQKIGFKEKTKFYTAQGCSYCNNTGFYGRIAILEVIMIDDEIRDLVMRKKSIDDIKKYAIEKRGMRTLRDDAFLKVKDGLTSLDEALRITTEE
ncbi:MAG: GspE/PulE family protein [Candidatus Omnitrophica bacterium]|nr:GspE/PulE family protein [Candidatus Omnitrophota bacterium]MDD5653035.1 GspE/PulE family protein [Candidatus Omnitrophota bacterium]